MNANQLVKAINYIDPLIPSMYLNIKGIIFPNSWVDRFALAYIAVSKLKYNKKRIEMGEAFYLYGIKILFHETLDSKDEPVFVTDTGVVRLWSGLKGLEDALRNENATVQGLLVGYLGKLVHDQAKEILGVDEEFLNEEETDYYQNYLEGDATFAQGLPKNELQEWYNKTELEVKTGKAEIGTLSAINGVPVGELGPMLSEENGATSGKSQMTLQADFAAAEENLIKSKADPFYKAKESVAQQEKKVAWNEVLGKMNEAPTPLEKMSPALKEKIFKSIETYTNKNKEQKNKGG